MVGSEIYRSKEEAERQFRDENKKFKKYASEILDFVPIKSGNLLDIGCGIGWVVAGAKNRGFEAKGIDTAKPFIEIGRKKLGVDLIYSDFESFKTNEKFDVIIIKHVLEHIKNPSEFLSKAKSLLMAGGIIVIASPNIESIMFRIFRQRWYGLQQNQHEWQFSPDSLAKLLELNGLSIEKVTTRSLDYQPGGIKQIIFDLLTAFSNIIGMGDQVFAIAKNQESKYVYRN